MVWRQASLCNYDISVKAGGICREKRPLNASVPGLSATPDMRVQKTANGLRRTRRSVISVTDKTDDPGGDVNCALTWRYLTATEGGVRHGGAIVGAPK